MVHQQSTQPLFVVEDNAMSPDDLRSIRAALQQTRLVGDSTLVGGFEATRGFGLTVRKDGFAELHRRWPWLVPFLQLALDEHRMTQVAPARRGTGALWDHLVGRRGATALYVNVLVVPAGTGVSRHIDATLGPGTPRHPRIPRAVAVLYIDVPQELQGGALRFWNGDIVVGEVQPIVNRFLHFAGHLGHEVTPVQGARGEALRTSLVCEIYSLDAWTRKRHIPRLRVHSRGFEQVLQEARMPGARQMELERSQAT